MGSAGVCSKDSVLLSVSPCLRGEVTLRVTDIKQEIYCPRICYWNYLMPVEKRLPPKMEYGAADHALLAHLEARRTLRAYGVSEGSRRFHVRLTSERMGLTGVLDALLETPEERI